MCIHNIPRILRNKCTCVHICVPRPFLVRRLVTRLGLAKKSAIIAVLLHFTGRRERGLEHASHLKLRDLIHQPLLFLKYPRLG